MIAPINPATGEAALHTMVRTWQEANDSAERAGRLALDGIRYALFELAELSGSALQQGRRGSLKGEAEELEHALRTALHLASENGRPPMTSQGEFRNEEHVLKVREARRSGRVGDARRGAQEGRLAAG